MSASIRRVYRLGAVLKKLQLGREFFCLLRQYTLTQLLQAGYICIIAISQKTCLGDVILQQAEALSCCPGLLCISRQAMNKQNTR